MAVEAFSLSLSPMRSFYNSALLDSHILLTWKPPVFTLGKVGSVGGAPMNRDYPSDMREVLRMVIHVKEGWRRGPPTGGTTKEVR